MSRDEEQSLVRWRIAEFDLIVDPKTVRQASPIRATASCARSRGADGCASRARPTVLDPSPKGPRFVHAVEVVTQVVHPETEISLADAQVLRSGAAIGETVEIAFDADRAQLRASSTAAA